MHSKLRNMGFCIWKMGVFWFFAICKSSIEIRMMQQPFSDIVNRKTSFENDFCFSNSIQTYISIATLV